MPRIKIDPYDFNVPFHTVMDLEDIDISWSELIWAAVTVGRANLHHIVKRGVKFCSFS